MRRKWVQMYTMNEWWAVGLCGDNSSLFKSGALRTNTSKPSTPCKYVSLTMRQSKLEHDKLDGKWQQITRAVVQRQNEVPA